MAELSELKRFIGVLEQAETNRQRSKAEMESTQRKLEGLHAEISRAENRLLEIKAEAEKVKSDAAHYAEEITGNVAVKQAEAEVHLSEAKKIERTAQAKLSAAEDLKAQHEKTLAEVTLQREKLKAALV